VSGPAPGVLPRQGLGPVARAVGAASFFADVCQGIAGALLPRLVTGVLGAPASALGVIEGLSDGAGGAARLVGGAVSGDTRRRRVVAVGGYAATAASLSALGAAPGPAVAGALRVAGVASFNFRIPARNSVLADAVPTGSLGRAFGFERAMAAAGAIAGPLVAIGLLRWLGIRGALGAAILPGLAATAAIAWAVRRGPARPRRSPLLHLPVARLLGTGLRRLLAALTPFELGRVGSSFLILRATDVLAGGRGPTRATEVALALLAAHNALGALVAAPAGRLCDRTGPRPVLVAGVAAMSAGILLLVAAGAGPAMLVGGFLVTGAGDGALQPAVAAAVARAVPAELRAAAFGLTSGLQGIANLVAGATIGLLWTAVSPEAALGLAAGWMAVALVLLLREDRSGGEAGS
jgi:MFS family permease